MLLNAWWDMWSLVGKIALTLLIVFMLFAKYIRDREQKINDAEDYIQKVLYPNDDVYIKQLNYDFEFNVQGDNIDETVILELNDDDIFYEATP